jgi:hypothetical protein
MAAQTKRVCVVNKECEMQAKRSGLPLVAMILGCVVFSASSRAQSGPALERVEVSRGSLRSDVLSACPQAMQGLQSGMERAVSLHGIGGSYVVHFDLSGTEVHRVQMPRLPLEYRRALRNAVRELQCQDGAAQRQTQRFGFILDVRSATSSRGGKGGSNARPRATPRACDLRCDRWTERGRWTA